LQFTVNKDCGTFLQVVTAAFSKLVPGNNTDIADIFLPLMIAVAESSVTGN
jgi:hypothetical protein